MLSWRAALTAAAASSTFTAAALTATFSTPSFTATTLAATDASTAFTTSAILEKMISWPDGRSEGRVNSCPFCVEGIREIEDKMGSESFKPIARQLEWPTHREQGIMKCDNSCKRKEKKGFHGLYTHARVDNFNSAVMEELHHLLCKVMNNERARLEHEREPWQLGRHA